MSKKGLGYGLVARIDGGTGLPMDNSGNLLDPRDWYAVDLFEYEPGDAVAMQDYKIGDELPYLLNPDDIDTVINTVINTKTIARKEEGV
jgi:hypothetical protein